MVLKANFLTWLSKLSWSISKEIQVDNWLILIFLNIAAWMLLLRFSDPYKIVKFWFLLLNFLFLFSKIQKFYSILIILHCGFRDNCNWSCFKWILHISTHQSICIRIMSLFFRSKMNWCVEVMTVSVHKCCTSAAKKEKFNLESRHNTFMIFNWVFVWLRATQPHTAQCGCALSVWGGCGRLLHIECAVRVHAEKY